MSFKNLFFLIAFLSSFSYPQIIYAELELKDIKVTTPLRKNTSLKNTTTDTTVILEDEIEQSESSTLTELLQRQPGIEISNLGGPGKVSSINIRGTSSTHSIVLIDGIRIGASTSGLAAIENIPLNQVERIEIIRGPASSLYGQDAIGGVIQIFTKKGKPGFHPYAGVGYGRYKTKSYKTGIQGGNEDTTYAINISGLNTDGFSAFVPDASKDSNSQNIDRDHYRNKSVSASLNQKFYDNYELDLNYFLSTGLNLYDNRYANYYSSMSFRNKSKQQIMSAKGTAQINENWQSSIMIGQSLDHYADQQKYNMSTYDYDENVIDLYQTTKDQLIFQNDLNYEIGSFSLLYDFLNEKIKTTDTYDKSQRQNHGFVLAYDKNYGQHHFQTSIREDFNSQYDNETTGSIGYGYDVNSNWTVSMNFGTAFVAPSFNYLYSTVDSYALGNPDLKPEKSKNIEIMTRYNDESSHFSFVIYKNEIDDFIIYDGANAVSGSRTNTQNLNKAEILGGTVSFDKFFGHLQIGGNFTHESSKNEDTDKYLPRRAKFFGNLNINYYVDQWIYSLEMKGSGNKYDDKANDNRIEGYIISNLIANYKYNYQTTLNVRLDNVFDKDYALAYEGSQSSSTGYVYQTPGRGLYANLLYQF